VSDQGWKDVCNVYDELLLGMYNAFDSYLIKFCEVTFSDCTNLHVLFHDAYIPAVNIVMNVEEQFIVK